MNRKHELTGYLKQMLRIRFFEEKVGWLFTRGKILGTSHLCTGQEAVATGACAALGSKDLITSNHRGHGHFIAKGGDTKKIMAEIFGKSGGYCKGKGGTQHMFCAELGHMGSNGITGGQIPVATGIAFAIKYREEKNAVLCFLGDGATNQGTFHESLNMASIWKLPIVYLCENNLYAMSTHVARSIAIENISDRAASYGIPGQIVDGNDVLAVKETVSVAVDRAKKGMGPSLIEAKTYRLGGHSKSDLCSYRTRDEEKDAWDREPIKLFEEKLVKEKLLTAAEIKDIELEIKNEIEAAVEFAEKSPIPGPDVAFEDLVVCEKGDEDA